MRICRRRERRMGPSFAIFPLLPFPPPPPLFVPSLPFERQLTPPSLYPQGDLLLRRTSCPPRPRGFQLRFG